MAASQIRRIPSSICLQTDSVITGYKLKMKVESINERILDRTLHRSPNST
ncbi:hypothetical protein Bca101_091810 [Brassica carinata]